MDASQLKAAGFSDQEIAQYEGLKQAGFSEKEINEYYEKQVPKEQPKGILRSAGDYAKDIAQSQYVRPTLEAGGAILGGMAGLASPMPGGAVIGAGLGAGIGSQVANIIQRKPWAGAGPEAVQVGKDVLTGAGTEMGGGIVGKGIQAVGKRLVPYAESVYGSAIKTPVTEKWRKLFPGREGTARMEAVKTGLEGGVLPDKLGLRVATARADALVEGVTRRANELTKTGEGGITYAYRLRDEGLRDVSARARMSSSSKKAGAAVKEISDDVIGKAGVGGQFTPREVLDLKRQFDKEIIWGKEVKPIDINGQFSQEARMGIRDAAMKKLEEMDETLKYLNKKSGAYIDLKEAIERTIAHEANQNTVGFGSKILALKSMGLAALDATFRYNKNKARLAFAIKEGAKWEAKKTSRIASYGALGMSKEDMAKEWERTVIQYDSQGNRLGQ